MNVKHFAVCYEINGNRSGVVESFPCHMPEYQCFPKNKARIGYVGCENLEEAVTRAGKMERNESGAWGIF